MRNFLILMIVFFGIQVGSAQNLSNTSNENIYNTSGIEVLPEYPGGIGKFYQFIGDNYKTPTAVDFLGGKVYVSFIIEKDGSVADIKVLRDVGFGTGKEAIRVLELCPKWSPGRQNGKNVRCSYSLPISLQPYVFSVKEVDVKPNYEGGFEGVSKIIAENYKKPTAKEFKGGEVQITFTVEIDGSLSDIKVYKDLGFGTGEEAVRVLSGIKNWIPAKKQGKKVRCDFGLPIRLSSN
ncbi:MAG: energy transducer TonB [Flavobacterium sp.]|nr:energy transducer TonB [Pseudarcicella sp.]MBP6758002.1 energy transducer TonB [Flavobacterium sp.]